jgi:hypothetical protein
MLHVEYNGIRSGCCACGRVSRAKSVILLLHLDALSYRWSRFGVVPNRTIDPRFELRTPCLWPGNAYNHRRKYTTYYYTFNAFRSSGNRYTWISRRTLPSSFARRISHSTQYSKLPRCFHLARRASFRPEKNLITSLPIYKLRC